MCRAHKQHEAGGPTGASRRGGWGGGCGGSELPSPAAAAAAAAPRPSRERPVPARRQPPLPSLLAPNGFSPATTPRAGPSLPAGWGRRRSETRERAEGIPRFPPSPAPPRALLSREPPRALLCPPAGGTPLSRERRGSHARAVVSEGRARALSGRRAPPPPRPAPVSRAGARALRARGGGRSRESRSFGESLWKMAPVVTG